MNTSSHQADQKKPKAARKLLVYLIIAFISGISGASFALVLASSPFRHTTAVLPNSSKSITTIIPTQIDRPVNILILGIDNSGHPHQAAFTLGEALSGNSDTMLLIRLLPKTHQVNILSLPRDTRAEIPGVGADKINAANVYGGMPLAASTVSQLLRNIPIDRYIRVDTEGFIHLVDALGGVEVNVPKAMKYVDRSQNLNINFVAGNQTLNGQHLQEYVRFRHDALGDIGRVQRQQEVLQALLHKLIQPDTFNKVQQLLQIVQQNLDTDLSLGEMLAIYHVLTGVDRYHLNMVMLPGRFSLNNEYDSSYWIENTQATDTVLTRYFDVSIPTEVTQDDQQLTTQKSQASKTIQIALVNATGQSDINEKAIKFFRNRGFSNVYIADHEIDSMLESTGKTQIIAQQGNPDIANLVKKEIGVGQVQVEATGDLYSDVTVIIREDLATKFRSN
ncbi:MAG: LytR family transcriptional regulator [Pseudanabaena sp.]|nr:MAG: LytR family transcriptional regulator [Pseudanabaena sp.]